MSDDPINHEDQRQARDHYRAVNKLIGEEDLDAIKRLLDWISEHLPENIRTNMPADLEDGYGLLVDILEPEGIGA